MTLRLFLIKWLIVICVPLGLLLVFWFRKSDYKSPPSDLRNIRHGLLIPSDSYADQPYIVPTDDGAWLCLITTGSKTEGSRGQHIVSMRSLDQGVTWQDTVSVEPSDGPEASYAVPLKTGFGRIYAFYNYNTDRIEKVKREDGGSLRRVDSLGHYVFKYSDDHGRSWSTDRYEVPVREFECDSQNVYNGKIRFFWNVGKPLILNDRALLTLHKVGALGKGLFTQSEGAFLSSKNILNETDPNRIEFETLPRGGIGLRAPRGGGRIAEEQSIVSLSDESIYCVYRTVDGWPASSYSRDKGNHWSEPEYASYSPGGRRIKNPRAANFVWKCQNGRYLYWFHNHGGKAIGRMGGDRLGPYEDRNPAWLMAGHEEDTPNGKCIVWSEPEILLYDDDPFIRISYPDLVERRGKFYVTETQKNVARLHLIPPMTIEGLFDQHEANTLTTDGLIVDWSNQKQNAQPFPEFKLPKLHQRDSKRPDFGNLDLRSGFSFDLWLDLSMSGVDQVLFDNLTEEGKGIRISIDDGNSVRITLCDGRQESSWTSDRNSLKLNQLSHCCIIVDGGPKLILFVMNGSLCDGGEERQFGWARYSSTLRTPDGSAAKVSPAVRSIRVYDRAIRVSEAVSNSRVAPPL